MKRKTAINGLYERKLMQLEHDLREPLKNISNFLNLIKASICEKSNEQIEEYINFAIDAIKVLNEFSEGIINERTLENHPINLENIINDIISLDKTLFEKRKVKVLLGNIPKLTGEYSDFLSLFKNLIENSIIHSSNEEVIIIIKTKTICSNFIVISFLNNDALNIKDIETIALILKTKNSGGLAICKNIVRKLKGKLELNKESKNLSYDITLPL